MPSFIKRSISELNTCHKDLQTIFNEVIKEFDCSIIQGYRDKYDQDEAYKEGKTKVKYPDSKHNKTPSMAVDAYPYPINFNDTDSFLKLNDIVQKISKELKSEGKISHSVRWGGAWNGERNKPGQLDDLCHFELV